MTEKIIALMRRHPRSTALVAIVALGGFVYLFVTDRAQEALQWLDSLMP